MSAKDDEAGDALGDEKEILVLGDDAEWAGEGGPVSSPSSSSSAKVNVGMMSGDGAADVDDFFFRGVCGAATGGDGPGVAFGSEIVVEASCSARSSSAIIVGMTGSTMAGGAADGGGGGGCFETGIAA